MKDGWWARLKTSLATPDSRITPSGEFDKRADELFSGWRWAVPFLAVLVVTFFSRFLFTGRFFLMRDLVFDFFAREEFYKSHLLQGVLPLWNSYTGGGEPFLSNMESAVFYPPNLLYLFLPVPIANTFLVTLHVFLAAVGVWLACRAWRVSNQGALLAAVAFAFSTQTVTRIEFFSFLCSYSWYPLAVALFTMWLRRSTLRKFLLLAMVFSLQLMGGYPGALLFTSGTLLIYAIVAGLFLGGRSKIGLLNVCKLLGALVGMGLVAMMLSMAQVMPVLDILPFSVRARTLTLGLILLRSIH